MALTSEQRELLGELAPESPRGPLDSITIPTLIRFLLKLWAAQLIIAVGAFLIVAVLALLARAFGLLPTS